MMKYCILVTEGPHDQAYIGKVLQFVGFHQWNGYSKTLDSFWKGFIPTYPRPSGKLHVRLDMPSVFTCSTHSIAIYCGEGTNLVKKLKALTDNNPSYKSEIYAFGLVIDADNRLPVQVARKKATELRTIFPTISSIPGLVTAEKPRTGIYVFPDNQNKGALDMCLVKCANVSYPDHLHGAMVYLDNLDGKYTNHLLNPFTRAKAEVACIVSVLQPGASNTASIAKDDWICQKTMKDVDEVSTFRAVSQ